MSQKSNAKETVVEAKYQELLRENDTVQAIQLLSEHFSVQAIAQWMQRKAQNRPQKARR